MEISCEIGLIKPGEKLPTGWTLITAEWVLDPPPPPTAEEIEEAKWRVIDGKA